MAGQTGRLRTAEAWWRKRQRLSRHRRFYRARTRTALALPGRRPRLAYLFAIVPTLAIVALLALSPFLYQVGRASEQIIDETPVSQIIQAENPGEAPIELPNWDRQERVNILVIGVDYREGDQSARTDTMIIVSIDPKAKTVGMLSLPRDLQVSIPGYGDNKINAAYVFGELDKRPGGGIGLLQRTIRANFGIQIHYYGTVNFVGFEKIVDTFGGVTVDPRYPIQDDEYPTETYGYTSIYFPAGLQHLDGKSALQYARTRHQDLDFGRSQRQQEVILALRQQAVKGNLLNNFYKLFDVLKDSVKTDLNQDQIAQLANLGLGISDDKITQYTLQDLLTGAEGVDGSQYLTPIEGWSAIRARVRQMVPNANVNAPTPTPDLTAKIGVQNGTVRDRFAARTVEGLKAKGLSGAVVDPTEVTGVELPLPYTVIYEWSKTDTAFAAAKFLGLGEEAVVHGTGTPPNGVDILIILGNDATDLVPETKATPRR
jgi:LCP family protein required for cell wall assembly